MIMRKSNKKDGEPLTLDVLMSELNKLFGSRKDDPAAKDIRSMIQSLVNGEACFEEEDVPTQMDKEFEKNLTCDDNTFVNAILGKEHDEKAEFSEGENEETICIDDEVIRGLVGGLVGYNNLMDATDTKIVEKDVVNEVDIPVIGFISTPQMMEGVVETMRSMKCPTMVGYEGGKLIKAYIACGDKRNELIKKHGAVNALVFDEDGGMCRLAINRKDGHDFIYGSNDKTRFIIFDETVCPDIIPNDIIKDTRKWGKRMSNEIPQLIEKRLEESKEKKPIKAVITPFPETCAFENCPHDVKKPIIGDIMKEFADAKKFGKVKDDTFVEFMKPENKDAVAAAVATSIAERQNSSEVVIEKDDVTKAVESAIYEEEEDNFSEEDTNPDCFRCIAEYMVKEGVDSVHFYTDEEGLIHCDVQIKTVYKVELEDSDKK